MFVKSQVKIILMMPDIFTSVFHDKNSYNRPISCRILINIMWQEGATTQSKRAGAGEGGGCVMCRENRKATLLTVKEYVEVPDIINISQEKYFGLGRCNANKLNMSDKVFWNEGHHTKKDDWHFFLKCKASVVTG